MYKIYLTSQELDDLSRILIEKMRSISCSNVTRTITPERMRHLHTKINSYLEEYKKEEKEEKEERDSLSRERMEAED